MQLDFLPWDMSKGALCSGTLDCFYVHGRHTGELIGADIERILQNFQMKDKTLAVVTDTASNIIKAVKEIKLRHLSCYAHTLNLVITDSVNDIPVLVELREKAFKIFTLLKRSTVDNDKFQDIQKSLGIQPKKLIQEVATRWNFTYAMLERLQDLKSAVTLLLTQRGIQEAIGDFGSNMWLAVDQAVEVLQP